MLRTLIAPTALAVVLVSCVSTDDYNRSVQANERLQEQLAALAEYQSQLEDENQRLSAEVIRVGKIAADAAWVEQQKATLTRLLAQFQDGGILSGTEGVVVKQTSEGLAFQVQGELLFASGSAEVTSGGQDTLRSLIPTLQAEGKPIRVDGHTDDEPISRSAWESNLELSTHRALAVAQVLLGNGLPREMVFIAAFGQFRPAVRGSTEEARKANRRVEILMVDG